MIIVIVGPTGSGKSALAMRLARHLGGQIVNGDAFQVYQELNIGTAKPSYEAREKIPHHLYDFVSPSIDYNVKNYQQDLREVLDDLLKKKKPVILVGGTGLYIKAGLYDYVFEDEPVVDLSDLEKLTNQELYEYLKTIDAVEAEKLHPNNRKRVLRAIAIYRGSGASKTSLVAKQKHKCLYDTMFIGLDTDRLKLYASINTRVNRMFAAGLIDEVRDLVAKSGKKHHAFLAIGYKEVIQHLEGKMTFGDTVEAIQKNSRNYAKRQFTFFRNQLPVEWYPDGDTAYQAILKKLGDSNG
ncbi:MAG: tRNA (adenosine(37)-N6)-dimethylallyltransferase MiaA [Firmicutes bacterium]|nr:tRNA (adenosine(37)-N6)-dimethylallyltransferase MiaA [Bacillota bacterium]